LNLRPSGYEPDELPGCSTPRQNAKRGIRPRAFRELCSSGECVLEGPKLALFRKPSCDSGKADSSFGDGLAAAARSVIADGRQALADPELSDPEAVHEVRKALKRWRALLRLLARPLGEQADQMRGEARELMRAVAGARDAQSALDALSDL